MKGRKILLNLTETYLNYYNKVNRSLNESAILKAILKNTTDKVFIPQKKHETDAGFDCRARIDEPIILKPGKRVCVPLGFAINIPINHTGDLRPRSGLTKDYGIMVGYGTIDAGYTGEVKATVFNFGEEDFTIHSGDRIAQLVILPIASSKDGLLSAKIAHVDNLVELERGENGHGSSGIK